MTRAEERDRLYALIEKANRQNDNDCKYYKKRISGLERTIDQLREKLGMSPLHKQEPAKVLRLVKRPGPGD